MRFNDQGTAVLSPNCDHTGKGKKFQIAAASALSDHFNVVFALDVPIPIGTPAKNHCFDMVSNDGTIIGECKNYCWTETGNMPSAKMAFLNEAVLYLSLLPIKPKRFIVMRRDHHPKRKESLAEYYYRTYRHLLDGITVFELDDVTGSLTEIK